jgi:probable F420-dependent oxidoreductase
VKLDIAWVPDPDGGDDDRAAVAERAGYDAVLLAEISHDPFLALAVASRTTSRIDLGTGIAVAFARSPMTTALAADDLQRMSGGRFILGLGTQVKAHVERRFSMPWSRPADRMREYVLALRAIWHSWHDREPLRFEGEFYRHTLMTPVFDPGPNPYGPPKVFVAAVGERMTNVAGEVADGLLIHPFSSPRYLAEVTLPALEQGLAASGRDRSDVEVGGAVYIATGRDEAELAASREELRSTVSFYASTLAYRPVLDLHGWGELQPALNDLARRGAWSEMGSLVSDEVLETLGVIAPLDDLAGELHRRYDGLLDRMTFSGDGAVDPDRYASFVEGFKSDGAVRPHRSRSAVALASSLDE